MTRKIHIPEVARVKRADPKNDFVFSDDIAKWMPKVRADR
jgi:hypothetical protein